MRLSTGARPADRVRSVAHAALEPPDPRQSRAHRQRVSAAIDRPRNSTMSATGLRRFPGAARAGCGGVARTPFHHGFLAALLGVEIRQFESGAEAALAPAVPRVEREQARVELGEARPAGGARALGGEHPHRGVRGSLPARARDRAEIKARRERRAARRRRPRSRQARHRHFDGVLREARQPRPFRGGSERRRRAAARSPCSRAHFASAV